MPGRGSAQRAAVGAAMVIAVLVVLSDTLFGGRVFSTADNIFIWAPFSSHRPAGWIQPSNFLMTDPVEGWLPTLRQTRTDLSHAVLPLWNPDAGGGRPLFASQVDALLYPLTWLSLILPFLASFAWVAALKLALALWGTFWFARDLALGRGPALLAALSYALGLFFVVWLQHPQTLVWLCLPWMMLATRRVCVSGGLGATALLGLSTGLAWLGGHPESAAFLMAAVLLYAVFEIVSLSRRPADAGGAVEAEGSGGAGGAGAASLRGSTWAEPLVVRAGLVIGGLLLGVALGAVAILPLLELLHAAGPTNRGGPALPFDSVISFVFPGFWGMPNKATAQASIGPVNFNERTAYFGALPLLLAVAALHRRAPRTVWFLLGLAILSFLLTFDIPGLSTAIRDLPEGNVARLTRFLIVLSFCGALMAGYGLQRWITGSAVDRRRMMIAMIAMALIPAVLFVIVDARLLSHLGTALGQLPAQHFHEVSLPVVKVASAWRWVLVCLLGLVALAVVRWRRWPAWTAVAMVVVLTIADLGTLDRNYHGAIPASWAAPPAPAQVAWLRAHQGEQRVTSTDFGMLPDVPVSYGLREMRVGIDIPYPQRYSDLWTALGGINGDLNIVFGESPTAHRLADIFATRYVFVPTGGVKPKWLRVVERAPGGVVGLNRTALPRAWVAYGWQQASGRTQALTETVASSTRTLKHRPVIEGVAFHPGLGARPTAAHVTDDSTDEVTITATATHPGYLVLDDSAYPGWDVTVDGHASTWHDANENFRAVAIPAGHHTVVFHYRPSSVYDGAIISAVALLGIIALAVAGTVTLRRRRRAAAGDGRAAATTA